jgi:hypothetical protein
VHDFPLSPLDLVALPYELIPLHISASHNPDAAVVGAHRDCRDFVQALVARSA